MNTFHKLSTAFIWMGVQVLLFVLTYTVAFEFVRFYSGSIRHDIGYGLMLNYGLYLFGALAAANGVIQTSALSVRAKIIGASACAGIFFVYLLQRFSTAPYRSGMLLAIGIACLFVPLLANRRASA